MGLCVAGLLGREKGVVCRVCYIKRVPTHFTACDATRTHTHTSLCLVCCYFIIIYHTQFLCHLQVSLLEPSKAAANADTAANAAAAAGAQHHATAPPGGHHTEHAMTASGASKLRSLLKGHQQEQDTAPPLTSRYIRVANTFDVVSSAVVLCWHRCWCASVAAVVTPVTLPTCRLQC